jgi:hypothetical protein
MGSEQELLALIRKDIILSAFIAHFSVTTTAGTFVIAAGSSNYEANERRAAVKWLKKIS